MRFMQFVLLVLAATSAGCDGSSPGAGNASLPGDGSIAFYGLEAPGGKHDIEQASGLQFGEIGQWRGLWLVCDRNGGLSASRLFFFSTTTLQAAKHGGRLRADLMFPIVLPDGDWPAFVRANRGVDPGVLEDLRQRILSARNGSGGPQLDLESITIAPSPTPPHDPRVFVVAEEPSSAILELRIMPQLLHARLESVHVYPEAPGEHGTDCNDGLEGLVYAGYPGRFFWAEEGTKYHGSSRGPRLFFLQPRLGRGTLISGRLEVERRISGQLTQAVRERQSADTQTLNALAMAADGTILAVDRNGGWILRVDPGNTTTTAWLNLYDLKGTNLRKALAMFPGQRIMPYISIEGIAVEPDGTIWLADDPAMPESFHASCLIRLRGFLPADRATTASAPN